MKKIKKFVAMPIVFLTILLLIFNSTFLINNCFSQWFIQQSGTSNALYDIEFINKNTGWCSGDGVILKTTNGGINWIHQTNGVPSKPYSGIHPVDSNVVYAVGFFRTYIKTTNGGENWTIIENGSPGEGDYYSVFFLNQTTGWAQVNYGSIAGIRKTTDGGNNFSISEVDLYFKDSLNGIGVGGGSYIFRTTNGGVNWLINQLAGSGDFHRVSFINKDTGYAASHRAVYKTTNFGISWDSIGSIPSLHTTYGCEFSSDSIGWVATSHELFKTTNGGRNWITQNITSAVTTSIWSYNDSLVWTCGNLGLIWHTTTGGDTTTNINKISSSVPNTFSLYQNFPNPFNSQTTIKFDVVENSTYKIEIIDCLGRKIDEPVNKYLNSGSYSIIYNADNLSSGVYYY